jgi:hypothetical protein
MKAFDTDILTEILAGNAAYAERIARVPLVEQTVPIVVVEEIVRGRLNTIRQAEAGKARIPLEQAYFLFEQTLEDIRDVKGSFVDASGRALGERVAEQEDSRVHARSAHRCLLRRNFGDIGYA